MQTEIILDVQLKDNELSKFLLRHTYTRISGIFSVLLSVTAIVLLIVMWNQFILSQRIILLVLGCLFTIIQPCMLWNKGRVQLKQETFKKPFHYVFNEEGIAVSQEEYEEKFTWDQVRKVIYTKQVLYVYMTLVSAFIIPSEQCTPDQSRELVKLIKAKK